ncbi:hypothetical protein NX059_008009 [Plenodomus lindquistii]|nr:hypothetical protein NX059_008009 [Plenodomus lindquistii]
MVMPEFVNYEENETTTVVVFVTESEAPSPVVTEPIRAYQTSQLALSKMTIHRSSIVKPSSVRFPPELTMTAIATTEPVKTVPVETVPIEIASPQIAPAETTLAENTPTGTAPVSIVADESNSTPLKYDDKLYYLFLLLALLFLMFGGALWYWVRRRAKKRRQAKGQVEGNRDADTFLNMSWSCELPEPFILKPSKCVSRVSFGGKSHKRRGPAVLKRSIAIRVSTDSLKSGPESLSAVAPWEAYEGPSWVSLSGRNRGMVPLKATKKFSREELARRHTPIPIPAKVFNTTCSGPITPAEYLDADYVHPDVPRRHRVGSIIGEESCKDVS